MNKIGQNPAPLAAAVQEMAEENERLKRENRRLTGRLRSVSGAVTRLRRRLRSAG